MGRAARGRRRRLPRAGRLPPRALGVLPRRSSAPPASPTPPRRAASTASRACRSPRSRSSARPATAEQPDRRAPVRERDEIARIYSTSGTTGTPSYIPLTAGDVDNWITGSARSYAASGVEPGQRIVSTYNAGPFAAGAALASFERIGLCHIPVGTGNTERLVRAIELLEPEAAVLTPSYAAHLRRMGGRARHRPRAPRACERVLVAGEPGGGEPAFRAALEEGWGARVTEAMGIGDIGVSLWGECEAQDGMHLGARGFVHAELIDPDTGRRARPWRTARRGELVLTHLRHRAAPLLRFRTRDHVVVRTSPCPCGRTGPRVRCIGRTDDMLIVRGVNVFPSARARGRQHLRARRQRPHPRPAGGRRASSRTRRCPVSVELAARRAAADPALAEAIRERLRTHAGGPGPRRPRARGAACNAASTSRNSSSTRRRGGSRVRKLQSQGVHHITIVGADRQTSIDFWEGVLGMPFVFEQPNLDNEAESHLYFDPGDGRLITVFTNEERVPDPDRTPDRPRLRAPPRVRGLAGDVLPGRRAPRRARHPPQRRQGPRVHGLDLLRGPARAADRARVLPLRAAASASRTPRCCSRPTASASSAATTTSTASTSPTRSRSMIRRSRESLSDDRAPADPYHHQQTACWRRREEERDGRLHAQHPAPEREQPDGAHLRARRGPGLSRRSTSGARRWSPSTSTSTRRT